MKFGISTGCFFPDTPINSLERAGKLGAKYVEVFFNTHSELEMEYLLKLKEIKDRYNITVVSIHPYSSAIETFMFFSVYDYKLEDSVKLYEKYFIACNILGCKYVVIHGCYNDRKYMDMERYCKNLNILSAKAREYGVYISQENVFKFKCGYINNIKEFVKYADRDVKFTFDIKQAVKARQSIYAIMDIVADRISHIHISDYKDRKYSLIPFTGGFNYSRFFDYVKNKTTAEAALIELYSHSFTEDSQLADALQKLDKYL